MSLKKPFQVILSLLVGVGILGNFIHCAEAFDLMTRTHHHAQEVAADHDHHEPTSDETCCDHNQEGPSSVWAPASTYKVSLVAVLPIPVFELYTESIPPALKRTDSTKDPPDINQELLAIKTIRLLL